VTHNKLISLAGSREKDSVRFKDMLEFFPKLKLFLSLKKILKKEIDKLEVKTLKLKDQEIMLKEWDAADINDEFYSMISQSHLRLKQLSNKKLRPKKEDFKEVPILYTWLKPQAKVDKEWVGNSILKIKINDFKLKCFVKSDVIVNMIVYNPPKRSMTVEENKIYKQILLKTGVCENLNFPDKDRGYYFGRCTTTNLYGYKQGHELGTVYDTMATDDDFYFFETFQINRLVLRENKEIDEVFYSGWHKDNFEVRLYSPLDLFEYPSEVSGFFLKLAEGENLEDKTWMKLIDHMVNLGLYNSTVTFEKIRNDINKLEISSFTQDLEDHIKEMNIKDEEDENIGVIEYFELLNNDASLKSRYINKVKEVTHNYSLKTKGYDKESNDLLNDLLKKMDVDPKTLPDDIRDIYIKKSHDIKINGSLNDFMKDLVNLIENNFPENSMASFLKDWGKESLAYTVSLDSKKSKDVLINFEYLMDSGSRTYYTKTLKSIIEVLDLMTFQHWDEVKSAVLQRAGILVTTLDFANTARKKRSNSSFNLHVIAGFS